MKIVYLTDDDEDDRDLFHQVLEEISADTMLFTTTNGEELLLQLYRGKTPFPQLIFLDLNMPRKDGIETLHEIKSHPRFSDIPIVIFTTSSHPDNIDATYCLGANRYVIKPACYNKLKEVIKTLITDPPGPAESLRDYVIS